MENQLLILTNAVLGIFAGVANGYFAFTIKQRPKRYLRAAIALLCTGAGIAYGAVLIDYLDYAFLGPYVLRPMIALLLLAMAISPFVYATDNTSPLEEQIEDLNRRMQEQNAEIVRLNDVIKVLVKQFTHPMTDPHIQILETGEKPPPILVAVVESMGLGVRQEMKGIFDSGLAYEYLAPPMSRNRMVAEMDRLRPKAVHLIGHMSAEGMLMMDGMASIGWWRRLFERYTVDFVFANGCESLDVVDALITDGTGCVIGLRGEMADDIALEFSRQFYAWLAAGRDAVEAVDLAKLSISQENGEMVVIRGNWKAK